MCKNLEEKLQHLKDSLLDKDYSLGMDEILGEIQYLFEDDKEVCKILDTYMDDFYKMFECCQKFYKVKDLVDEQFYTDTDE